MLRAGVSKRYARAFYDVAKAHQATERYAADLSLITTALREHKELSIFLKNPLIAKDDKRQRIHAVFGSSIDAKTLNLVYLLIESGRESYLAQIAEEFLRHLAIEQGIVEAVVESAIPLSDSQIEAVSLALISGNITSVRCKVVVNKALIGGLRLRVGDRVTDLSVAGRLEAFRKQIMEQRIS